VLSLSAQPPVRTLPVSFRWEAPPGLYESRRSYVPHHVFFICVWFGTSFEGLFLPFIIRELKGPPIVSGRLQPSPDETTGLIPPPGPSFPGAELAEFYFCTPHPFQPQVLLTTTRPWSLLPFFFMFGYFPLHFPCLGFSHVFSLIILSFCLSSPQPPVSYYVAFVICTVALCSFS